jgi:hypothetical protein
MISEKSLVVQSNPLIEARYSLGETEQKLLRVLVSMIKPHTDTLEKCFYRFSVQDFAKFLGHGDVKSLHKEMRKIARRLKNAHVRVIKPNGNIIETSWIASFEYPRNKGWIEFEISSKLEDELLRVKEQFTKYYLANISKLKGEYSVRIYELVQQYANSNLRSRKIDLEELRGMLALPDAYKQSSNLFQRIIRPSHEEICAKTDITFSFRPIKESRKIIAVEFYDIQKKAVIPPSILSLIPEKYRGDKDVLQDIQKYMELRGPEYVTEKINYTVTRNVENFAGYLHSTLENNHGEGFAQGTQKDNQVTQFTLGTVFEFDGKRYTFDGNGLRISDTKILNPEQMIHVIKAGLLIPISPEKLEKEQQETLRSQYEQYRRQAVDTYLASLSPSELHAAKESFVQGLDAFSGDIFKEKSWESPVINSLWRSVVAAKMKNLMSFQEFTASATP